MELHRFEARSELASLRSFLAESDPNDYLLDGVDEWALSGRLWVGTEAGRWVAFGRLHDLGHEEGWISGLRVARSRRGEGLGGEFLEGVTSDARSIGLAELRAVIEDSNSASRRLFARHGFRPVAELTLRRAKATDGSPTLLRPVRAGGRLEGPVGWIPSLSGRVDVLPGADAGRFGRWDPRILERWAKEGKLYAGAGMAAAVQPDWLSEPRTMWANPLQGEPIVLFPALTRLANALGQEEWQAYLPSTDELRHIYADLGLTPHPSWGDRVHLYESSRPHRD
jgi:GNAT superfamily N-acetyltransferase